MAQVRAGCRHTEGGRRQWALAVQFDSNGDGQISMAELREAMCKLLGQQLNYREVDEILKDVDLNGDGLVDFEGRGWGGGGEHPWEYLGCSVHVLLLAEFVRMMSR